MDKLNCVDKFLNDAPRLWSRQHSIQRLDLCVRANEWDCCEFEVENLRTFAEGLPDDAKSPEVVEAIESLASMDSALGVFEEIRFDLEAGIRAMARIHLIRERLEREQPEASQAETD